MPGMPCFSLMPKRSREIYNKQIVLRLKLDPDTVEIEDGFTRDMRGIGHYGTGDLEVSIKTENDFQKAKALIERAYNELS